VHGETEEKRLVEVQLKVVSSTCTRERGSAVKAVL